MDMSVPFGTLNLRKFTIRPGKKSLGSGHRAGRF